MNKYSGGLLPLPQDNRDLKVGALFKLPKLSDIPDEFVLGTLGVKDQGGTDYCAAFASCGASEQQELVELDPLYNFMLAKQIQGDPNGYGCDLRSMAKSFVNFGSIEKSLSPYTIQTPREVIVNPNSWQENFKTLAKNHKKASYVWIDDGVYDFFDSLRAYMWAYKACAVGGVAWCSEWTVDGDGIIEDIYPSNSGHAMYFKGVFKGIKKINGKLYIIAQLSNGTDIGDKGLFYFSRDVINHGFAQYGAFVFTDMPKEDLQHKQENGVKVGDNWFVELIKVIKNLISLTKPKTKVPDITPKLPQIDPKPPIPPPVSPRERLYNMAVFLLNKDASPNGKAPNDLACMDSVNCVYYDAFGTYIEKDLVSTTQGLKIMASHPERFVRVTDQEPGNIIICGTGTGNGKIPGHVGIFGKNGVIMSNNSSNGIWDTHLDIDKWVARYRVIGGFPIYIFKVI